MEIEGHYVSDYIRIYKNVFDKPTLNKIKKYAKDKPPFANIKNSTVYLSDKTKEDVVDESRNSKSEGMDTFITKSMTHVRITNNIISYFNFYARKYINTVLPIDELNLKINQIDLNFTYNFDQKIAELKDIKIDNRINENVNKILNNVILKKDDLQNKIYFKNLINQAIKSYAG